MRKRLHFLTLAALMATGCAHGVKPTPAPSDSKPNLSISADLLTGKTNDLPQPVSGAWSDLLMNHVAVAKQYDLLRGDFLGLVCAITGQQGVTINGLPPVQPEQCARYPPRPAK